MLSCDEALELISARLDGPLTQEETARLEEHLSVCPACRTLADDLEELHEELPQLTAQPPAGLKEGVMDKIHTSKVTPFQSKKRQWRWRSLASLAAVAALVLVGAGVMDQWRTSGFRGSEENPGTVSVMTETNLPSGGGEEGPVTREIVPQPTEAPAESNSPEDKVVSGSSGQGTNSEPDSRNHSGAGSTQTQEPVVVSQTPAGNGAEPYSVTPDKQNAQTTQATVNPFVAESGLTQSEALHKLAAWLGWNSDELTVEEDGAIIGPTTQDGTTTKLMCAGLNQEGTGWLCQLEQVTPGPDGTASCTTYTVPLDGSEIVQP
ncbi:MAG: anti-sigma factor [Clostridiales bacterium]|uniref:anti-sigma factor family protein n=1 Tax=Flavonifractor porci TaxID=3133422 RepID=UPI0030ACC89F|nr:anti-sigma factor [Clostridiales bacterium]